MATIVACLINLSFVWLIVAYTCVFQVMVKVHRDWNQPHKRNKRQPRSKGCSRYYARGSRKRRALAPANSRPNRVITKTVTMTTRRQMTKSLRYLPPLSTKWEEAPRSQPSCQEEPSRKPYGLQHCPASWSSQERLKRMVDCWEFCCQATNGAASTIRYDSDSFQIAIDNCATSCFTNSMDDFVGTPTKTTTKVTGIGKAISTHEGTVRWLIVDDDGSRHELLIPGTRFQQQLPFRLLSPQHVAQVYKDPKTTCLTLMDKVIFQWGGGKWKRTLPLHRSSNVAMMWSAPSNHKFYAYPANFSESHIIPDDEEEEESRSNKVISETERQQPHSE
jgi:hypothetical protein